MSAAASAKHEDFVMSTSHTARAGRRQTALAHVIVLLGLLVNELDHKLVLVSVPRGDVQIGVTSTFGHLAEKKVGGVFAFFLRQFLRLERVLDGRVLDAIENKLAVVGDGDGQMTCGEMVCSGAGGQLPNQLIFVGILELFANCFGQESTGGKTGGRTETGGCVKGREGRAEGEGYIVFRFSFRFSLYILHSNNFRFFR